MINGKTLYSKLTPEDVADYVVVSGDPWRVDKQAELLTDAKHIVFNREFNTYTGFYKGVRVTISSTGMGTGSAIEMLEELNECGAKVIVRMGTAGPTEDDDFGKFLIATSGMANDNVSLRYAPENYPIVVDHRLVSCLEEAVSAAGHDYVKGIVRSSDGGDAHSSITPFGKWRRETMPYYETLETLQQWNRYYGVKYMDFESAPLVKVGNMMGITVGSLCLATVILDRLKKVMHTDPEQLARREADLCKMALDGLVLFAQKYGDGQ